MLLIYTCLRHLPPAPDSGVVSVNYIVNMARMMYEQDSSILASVEPNIVNFRTPKEEASIIVGDSTDEPLGTGCPTNDPLYSEGNHIENKGFNVPNRGPGGFPRARAGVSGADAHICGCWEAGYFGQGVTVGVIGRGLFCFSQTDMVGRFDPAKRWDCTSPPCVPLANSNIGGLFSGQRMAGIIGANDNTIGTVGVAPEVNIAVYKAGLRFTFSTFSVIASLRRAMLDEVDIIITDLYGPNPTPSIDNELSKHLTYGRKATLASTYGRGTVIIATTGRTRNLLGSTASQYPAASPVFHRDDPARIISVIASDRFDKVCRHELVPGIPAPPYSHASNFGNQYDVACPGPRVPHPKDDIGPGGRAVYSHSIQAHDVAVATVGGIAAMLLEKDSTLTAEQVRQLIIQGADTVGGYTYTNGKSMELANGRVNCGKSLALVGTTTIDPKNGFTGEFHIAYEAEAWSVIYKLPKNTRAAYQLRLLSLLGQEIVTIELDAIEGSSRLSQHNLSAGLYMIQLTDTEGQVQASQKVIKY